MNSDPRILLDRAAPISDAAAVRPVRAETRRELLELITAAEPVPAGPPRRRRYLRIGVPVAVAAGCAVAVTSLALLPAGSPAEPSRNAVSPSGFDPRPVAALSFTKKKDHIEVRIKDPLADPRRYQREFAAHGMNIKLMTVPASPSVVGTIVMQDDGDGPDTRKIETIEEGRCVTGGRGDGKCIRGLRIPVGYRNNAEIAFGREARPGEQYSSTSSAFAPGEALHCLDIRGLTVDEAERRIAKRKLTVGTYNYMVNNYGYNGGREKIPGNWYVRDADPYAPGQIMMFVQKERPVIKKGAHSRALFKGCPS
ncbi:hypothetical protein [Actinomadura sp. 6K520]|uniref:hypothetical protein n=1 Tax=Actinomadura sp. 6K520 TaxID=2530364 RepID=UPI0010455543|nr:hypothetical protein [Actinomadura sp. 6K520]TDE35474.1 hypothetical protein E1289_07750 [Actinomadura sp. 6K520]